MTDALWLTTPWTDISGEVGQMDKTTVKFSIPMDNAISLRTVDDNGWFGEVSASGEIHVRRRGATLTKALLTVGCLLAAPLAQAISVGNLTFPCLPKRISPANGWSTTIKARGCTASPSAPSIARAAAKSAPGRWMANCCSPPPAGAAGR